MLRSWLFAQCDGFQYLIILAMISRRSETQLVQRTKFVLHVELVFQRFVVQQFWICLPVLSRITPLMPISRRSHLVIWDAYPCNLEDNGIVWGSLAKSSVGCGPVFNALWQQQESPSIFGYVIHCGLDSKSNLQWDGHAIIWDAESWPSGPVSRCPKETLAWLPKEVCGCLAELSQLQPPISIKMQVLPAQTFLMYIVGGDSSAFHATRRLAVN